MTWQKNQNLSNEIIELLQGQSNSFSQEQKYELQKILDQNILMSVDEQKSHLSAISTIPTYRGHIYEERIRDSLGCRNVGGQDVSDIYITEQTDFFENIVRTIYDFDSINKVRKEPYCQTFFNGISLEVKTSNRENINAPKVGGYLQKPFHSLSKRQQAQALNICNRVKKYKGEEELIKKNAYWVIDAKQQWADIYCFIFVDALGSCKQMLLVPSFILDKESLSQNPSLEELSASMTKYQLQINSVSIDWSCNRVILAAFLSSLASLAAQYYDEMRAYKEKMDNCKEHCTITQIATPHT